MKIRPYVILVSASLVICLLDLFSDKYLGGPGERSTVSTISSVIFVLFAFPIIMPRVWLLKFVDPIIWGSSFDPTSTRQYYYSLVCGDLLVCLFYFFLYRLLLLIWQLAKRK